MEWLTKECCLGETHCWQVAAVNNRLCSEVCETMQDCESCPIATAIDKLAAYEDTGLTPELGQRLVEIIKNLESVNGIDYLKNFLDADKDERLVVLPVKQDAIIYSVSKGCSVPMQSRLEGCFITESGEIEYQAIFGDVLEGDFGKTVFLSYEEAEVALKEAKKDG